LFGVGHLPAAAALVGALTRGVVVFIVAANSVFGVLFGYLYWKRGLETAIIAHATAHVVGYAAAQL
jgi:membrane protease YdiL (CAAX protease family)